VTGTKKEKKVKKEKIAKKNIIVLKDNFLSLLPLFGLFLSMYFY